MKITFRCLCVYVLAATAWAMPLGSSARAVIPADVQQIICVDYRTLKDSPTAMALKQQVLPPALKQFEVALRGVGINPDQDVDELAFASFRLGKQGIQVVGMAQGSFALQTVMKKIRLQKIRPAKYHESDIYPMSGGMEMTFLDDNTLLFGNGTAVRGALDARDGYSQTLDSNGQILDMMGSVDSGTVWSVLDQQGTQNMLRSALGDAARVADYDTVKSRLLGSRYTMNFSDGIKFDMSVVTSDSITAATLSSLLKMGMLYRKMNATPVEKTAMDDMTVDSDSSNLQIHFQTDDKQFQSLLHSDLFAAVSK
ncbi:MAG TPA: hypothetical protein VLV49_11985 [Terriglobales bacterium]|nr:hypothetical protein [Terriglobales bacterium]